jgi:ATP-binding cassette, subfamily B, bacterial PglK
MGPSGAGKSTLVDLLLGLVDPDEGWIEIDGRRVSEVRRTWQRHIGYVPQTIYLLDDTVRNNVALGVASPDVDDERVWRSLHQAQLAQLVEREPLGLDTAVGERGVRFSGGERQRLGIARALYRDPEVLVFDEATSALDVKTESEIAETLAALAGDKTVIIVAHRLTTVCRCEHVFYLEEGRLVDQGRLDGLLASNAGFRSMVGTAEE